MEIFNGGKEGLTALIPSRWLQSKIPKLRILSFFGLRRCEIIST